MRQANIYVQIDKRIGVNKMSNCVLGRINTRRGKKFHDMIPIFIWKQIEQARNEVFDECCEAINN